MFDISTIQTAFLSLIGWRDSLDPEQSPLASTLTASSSGLYFNDAHPLVTIENIDATAPDYDSMTTGVWAVGTTYALGARVRYSNITYISLQAANTGKTPSTELTWWKAILNVHIESLTKTAIVNMVERFINERQLQNASKALLEDVRLFDGSGRVTSSIIAQSRFVGFEIKVRNYLGLVASIKKVSAQFTGLQDKTKLYLFHSSQEAAVATFEMTTTKTDTAEWLTPVGFDMNFCKYAYNDAGGAWYVGYFEDDITGQAINRDIDLVAQPCGECFKDQYNRYSWEIRNRYISVIPCQFPASALNGVTLPDMDKVAYSSNENWGLNLAITAHCDLTDFFIDNKNIFIRALWKQVAHDVIKGIAFSTRIDGLKNELKADAYSELKGDPAKEYRQGIEHELNNEYKAINFAISDLNSPCMNKPKNTGLKVGSI